MNVLLVNLSLDPLAGGGTAERTFQLTRALARAGASPRVLATGLGLTRERKDALDAPVVALPCLWDRFAVPAWSPRIAAAVADADVVYLSNHWSMLNLAAWRAARRPRRAYVLCPAGALPLEGRSRRLKRLYNRIGGRSLVREADGWVAVTASEGPDFAAYGVDPSRVVVVPNGVEPAAFTAGPAETAAFRARHGLGQAPYVLFMGRLAPVKGPDLLLEAFCALPPALADHHLVFAGPDFGLGDTLRRRAQESPACGRIHFIGALGAEDRACAYAGARLVSIPSRREAMSLVVLEAGASGVPVLLTADCGFREVEEAGGGRVVAATIDGLRQGLCDLLGHPWDDLAAMGERLRARVIAAYTWDAAAARLLAVFEDVLRRR